jgi:predicted AlkP superfamily pyrophosphatase or phosphodiesterase
MPHRRKYTKEETSTFTCDLKALRNKNDNFSLISEIPQGNSLLFSGVKAEIKGEELGRGKEIDFHAVSFFSTDYLGHNFGIRSKELGDNHIRLDHEKESVTATLDEQVGAENYMVF